MAEFCPKWNDLAQAESALRSMLTPRSLRGVHAIGIGEKTVLGRRVGELSIQVYVKRKQPRSTLSRLHHIPENIDGVETDVVESEFAYLSGGATRISGGRSRAHASSSGARGKYRPLEGGISCAHHHVPVGTLGFFCRSRKPGAKSGEVCVLSSSHVLAPSRGAKFGDPIFQASPSDGGTDQDTVATLERLVPLKSGPNAANIVDAGIARLGSQIGYRNQIREIGPIAGTGRASVGTVVCKYGRTTGYTEGIVTSVAYETSVGVDFGNSEKRVFFSSQIRIEPVRPEIPFARHGDSGALIVDKNTRKALGLYFAGPASGAYGLASHIDEIERLLEVELIC